MSFLDSITSAATTVKDLCVEHSPEILTVVGATSIIAGTVIAIKQSTKAVEIIDNRNETIEDLERLLETDEMYTEKQFKKDKASVTRKAAGSLVKTYAAPCVLVLGGLGAMIDANVIEHSRLMEATADVTMLTGILGTFRANADAIFGEGAADKIEFGIETKSKQKVEEYDPETGKVKTVTKDIQVSTNPYGISRYAFVIDEDTTPEWDPNPDYTLAFIRGVEAMANDRLRYDKQHKLLLNDVRQMFTMEYTQEAAEVGWDLKNKNSDGRVIFRIIEIYRESKDDFGQPNGKYHKAFIVDPNVDGSIYRSLSPKTFEMPEDVVEVVA